MEVPIRNKVAESGIVTLDLSLFITPQDQLLTFDLKPFLFRELILREKDYRQALQAFDFSPFASKDVALYCSADAIIPAWAYMLAASHLQPVAASVTFGTPEQVSHIRLLERLKSGIEAAAYAGKRVVLKGCGDVAVPEAAYVAATLLLRPVVKSLMYGEPCSTVPVYKQPVQREAGA